MCVHINNATYRPIFLTKPHGSGWTGQRTHTLLMCESCVITNICLKSVSDQQCLNFYYHCKNCLNRKNYSYGMSEAALNMATRNMSIELGRSRPKVACVSIHPGTVNTLSQERAQGQVLQHRALCPSLITLILARLGTSITGTTLSCPGKKQQWQH